MLKSWGESESRLAELLAGRIEALDRIGNPTIAFQASGIEGLKIRITAKAQDAAAAEALIAGEEAKVRAIVGDAIFATDEQTMESVVLDLLRGRGLSLAVAESLTGGLVGARLTAVPGASDVFRGAVVSYASEVKFDLLGLPEGPVVSTDAAKAMALGVRERLGADVGIGHHRGRRAGGAGRAAARHGVSRPRTPGPGRGATGAPARRPPPRARVRGDQRAQPAAAPHLGLLQESRAPVGRPVRATVRRTRELRPTGPGGPRAGARRTWMARAGHASFDRQGREARAGNRPVAGIVVEAPAISAKPENVP